MFDQDDAGMKAAQEVAEFLPVGKCLIASLPMQRCQPMFIGR